MFSPQRSSREGNMVIFESAGPGKRFFFGLLRGRFVLFEFETRKFAT